MIKNKFKKGDLVWANLRGYGVVVGIGQKTEHSQLDLVGACDYAIIQWQNNLHGYQSRVFRGSIGWEKTHVRARVE